MVFPGSNCDRDMYHVLSDVFGADARYCWHADGLDPDLDAVVLPGGFSYGDRLRSGVIAAHSPVMEGVGRMAREGAPVLGVCNGFQILVEAGLLPGALLPNESFRFTCRWTRVRVENNATPFTRGLDARQEIPVPVANGEGRYYVDDDTLGEMRRNNQVVFRYAEHVNGSSDRIAGVCNVGGNVVGMMPHPERAAEADINPVDGGSAAGGVFGSLLGHARRRRRWQGRDDGDNDNDKNKNDNGGGGPPAGGAGGR